MQDESDTKIPSPQPEETSQPEDAAQAKDEATKSPVEEATEQEQPVESSTRDEAEEAPVAQAREEVPAEPAALAETTQDTGAAPAAGESEPAGSAQPEAPVAETAPPEPARPRMADLQPGMTIEGTVTRVEKYGAFVNLGLADRRDGLIHISELAPHRVRRVEDVVKAGDQVRVRVVSVDRSRGRIALSLNEAPEETVGLDEVNRPAEPGMTSMALAFERARGEKRTQARSKDGAREDKGAKSRREQEELMRRLSGER